MQHLLGSIFILCLLFQPLRSWAYSVYTPQGHREALMANTGIAMNASEGAAIYNPAGAAGLESARISAGGSFLNATTMKFGGNTVGNLTDKNTSPSFSQVPGLITGYQKFDWGRTGFFINTDYSISYDKMLTYSSTIGTSYIEFMNSLNSLNLGLIYANATDLNSVWRFQYGLTFSLALLENQTSSFGKSLLTAGTNTYAASFQNKNIKTTNGLARFGTLFSSADYSIGAYIQPQGAVLSNTYSLYSYTVQTDGTVRDDSKNSGDPLVSPETYGLGLSMNAFKSLRLYLDLNVTKIATGTTEGTSIDGFHSVGLGSDYTLNSGNHVYGGVTRTMIDAADSSSSNSNGWMVSSGFDYKISFIKNYFGAYYSTLESEASGNSTGTTITWFGVLIASQYAF